MRALRRPRWRPARARNHIWLTFTDPSRREMFPDWEQSARFYAAKFRAESARYLGDPEFEELIQALRHSSPEFCRAWKRHEVSGGGEGRKEIHHPVEGLMVFEHSVLRPQQALDQRVVLYSPRRESDTPAKLRRLMGEDIPTSELWLAGTAAGD